MKFEKKVSWKVAIALVLVASLISAGIVYVFAVSPSSTFTITSGIYPGAPSYTIWREGSNYFAKDANGVLAYSGTVATTVIQNVFNQMPLKVLFKEGIYDITGSTVIAYAPIVIEGEGKSSIISGGTLQVNGTGWDTVGWESNINVVTHLCFESNGDVIQLWFNGIVHGVIEANVFRKRNYYSVGVPELCLTDSMTIRVRDNWFDGYNMQILKINGTSSCPPLHIISDNDFGSTAIAFPSFTNPWDVAAIYIKGDSNWGINIFNNLAYLNDENIFVYSEGYKTKISFNTIACGRNNYVLDLQADENEVVGNNIWMPNDAKGAIAIRVTNNLTKPIYSNIISNNYIQGANSKAAIYGVLQRSIISNNVLNGVYYGILLNNSGYNLITSNFIIRMGPNANFGYNETGNSDFNMLMGNYAKLTYIFKGGGNSFITACMNNTVWIEHG
jgi:hypothetical protein